MFRYRPATLVREIIAILIAIVFLVPFYFLITTALKTTKEVYTTPAVAPPQGLAFENFATAWLGRGDVNMANGLFNSLVITSGTVIVLIFVGSVASYALARRPGRLSNGMYLLFLVAMIMPSQMAMIPLYASMRVLGLLGTHAGMIILYVGSMLPLAVFLYTGFARALSKDYEEAAQLDGASAFRTYRSVVFPLLAPATGTVAVMTFMIVWNDFMTPLIFLGGSSSAPLPVVLYTFVGSYVSQWNVIFAAVIITMVPMLAFYFFTQKKLIQGFSGGVKA